MKPLPEKLHQLSPELLLKQQPLLHCAFDVHGSPDSPEDSPDEAHAETKNAKIRCHERKLCIFVNFLCLLGVSASRSEATGTTHRTSCVGCDGYPRWSR